MNTLSPVARTLSRLALLSLLLPYCSAALMSQAHAGETPSSVVTSLGDVTADDGVTTLREAVAYANANQATDTVTFASGLSGTITLSGGELAITSDVTIQGPMDQSITLSGGNKNRIFFIQGAQTNVSISHLALAQGLVVGSDGTTGGQGAVGGVGGSAQGGAILNEGRLHLEAVTFTSNALRGGTGGTGGVGHSNWHPSQGGTGGTGGLALGGAVYSSGPLQIVDCTFFNNTAAGGTGGVGGLSGASTSNGSYPAPGGRGGQGGRAQGGAVYSSWPVQISGSAFSNNSAVGGKGGTGSAGFSLMVHISSGDGGNGSSSQGGALASFSNLQVSNSTLYGNSAVAGSGGDRGSAASKSGSLGNSSNGAFYCAGTLTLDSCTVCSNRARAGASWSGQVNNTLLVDNGEDDANATFTGQSNLVGLTVAQAGLQTDSAGTALLQDNGGPSPTIALVAGSVSLDAGGTSLSTDQRGFPRPVGSKADIGAFEQQSGPAPTPRPTATPGPTAAPTPTPTPQPTGPPKPTPQPTATPGPTPTSTPLTRPTPTPGPTSAPTPTPRPTATPTPMPTATPRPTATPAPLPKVSLNSPSVIEGSNGITPVFFTLTLSKASQKEAQVYVNTVLGTASPSSDYISLGKTLVRFAPGQVRQTVTVNVRGDMLDEDNETFSLVLSSPTGATLGTSRGTCTILDDDSPPYLSMDDVEVLEGNSGTRKATFTLALLAPSGREISVNYATQDRAAKAGSDYLNLSGTLTFAAGELRKTVSVTIKGDTAIENDEQFALVLSRPVNVTLARSSALCTIENDDGTLMRASPPSPLPPSGSAPFS